MFLPLLALSGRAVERAQTVFYCELFVWLIRTIRNGSCNVLYATTYACFGCHPLLYLHTFCGIATRFVSGSTHDLYLNLSNLLLIASRRDRKSTRLNSSH